MVLKGRVVIIVDGERIVDWSGEPRRLTSSLKLPGGQPGLFLSTNQSSFAVSKLVIASLMNGRLPLPSDGDLPTAEARAKKLIPEPAKLKLVTREERLRLATDLYARADLAIDDRPLQFVLLREAMNLAVEAGNMEWAWKIAQDQALWFPVDASEKIADAVERAKKATLPPEVSHAIADGALWLADEAVADSSLPPMDRLSATDRLLAAAKVFSSRKPEAQLTKEQTAREVWGRLQHRESDAAKKSQETLDTSPDDADANMSLGRYYVTSGGDWERALPCFVKSSSEWKDAAQRDAASPKLPDRQVAVADDWYKLAQSLKKDDPLAARCYRRARFWYEEALPNLQGTAKTSVERRLSDISAGTGLAAKIYAAPSGVINLQQLYKARVDHLVDFAWKTEPPDPAATNNNYIIRWNGWLDVPKAGQYTLVTDSHYFIRLKLDGELIMDAWAPHPPRVDSSRYLLSKPYSLEIEYYNNANGHMRLLWRQDCGFPEQVIAADYLFLQREQAAKALPGLR